MKTQIFSIFLFLVFVKNLNAETKIIKANLDKATVFLSGAQLSYNQQINFSKGVTDYVFEGVSPYLNQNSIMSNAKGDFFILDTKYNVSYPKETTTKKSVPKYLTQIRNLEDTLSIISFEILELDDKKNVLLSEKNLLTNNRMMKGEYKKDSLAILKDGIEYLRNRMNNINSELLKLKKEDFKINKRKVLLEQKLAEYNTLESLVNSENNTNNLNPTYQIIITISAANIGVGNLGFSYFVAQAGWSSAYEVRVNGNENKLEFFQLAKIFQNTGLDWQNVNLIVSTGNPSISNVKPNLTAMILGFRPINKNIEILSKTRTEDLLSSVTTGSTFLNEVDDETKSIYLSDYNIQTNQMTRVDYSIPIKYNIESNNQIHTVNIKKNNLNTDFKYVSIPKLDSDAFLTASVANWDDLNLFPGEAKIFFDGSFVGNTTISSINTSDTLSIDLGRDRTIICERKKLPSTTKEKILLDAKIIETAIEFSIRNTKSTVINYSLVDQIPKSNDKDIEVKLIQSSNGKLNEDNGLVTWNLKLNPKETKTIKLVYQIKIPINKAISGI
jgi:uncharacterized protein (TIGR02231 family)